VNRYTVSMDIRSLLVVTALATVPAAALASEGAAPSPAPAAVPAAAPAANPADGWPEGTDVKVLSKDGSAVGPLDKLRVPGKYTVFDVYADWCGPCQLVDQHLHSLAAARKDLAIRKLNVVEFESPLGRELGARFDALPYVVIFTPDGRRKTIKGADLDKLDDVLTAK